MRHSIRCRPGVALVLAGCAAAALAAAPHPQQPGQPSQEAQPTFRTGTNYVRVDVYPTSAGRPIQDLKLEDFDVLEDGVPQRIEAFEYVQSLPAGPQETRREPGTQRESHQEAANPRARVFVFFLDLPNVTVGASHNIADPVIRLMNRIVGPDDLVAIMTPDMSTSNLTLARKTAVFEQQLRENWAWGRRFGLRIDERERAYHACYPPLPGEPHHSALTREMIARKRERATFEALQDLVRWLRDVREERKAIITITEGWVRYRPNERLMDLRKYKDWQEPIPGPDVIAVGPTGKLTTEPTREIDPDLLSKRECDTDRMRLASMDNDLFFRQILDDANRANASFYPVDPRGLPAFDTPIGPDEPPINSVDDAILRERLESLHELALNTDGVAVLNNNDLDEGLRRIGDDLTSYYLLGYYSTNTKLDGRFRRLEVRVKRPGISVRARRGYRAPTAEEVAEARAASEAVEASRPSAIESAMMRLARLSPEPRFAINAAARPVKNGVLTVWIAGEIPRSGARAREFAGGGTAEIEVTAGSASVSTRVPLPPGNRSFVTALNLAAAGVTEVQVRARLTAAGSSVPESAAVEAPVGPGAAQPLVYRRGPSTGNQVVPAAEFRFSRSDRIRLELPLAPDEKAGEGRLLDRTGQPLGIPVKVAQRVDDSTGQHWLTAEIILAALAPGDYAVELSSSAGGTIRQVVTAFRVAR